MPRAFLAACLLASAFPVAALPPPIPPDAAARARLEAGFGQMPLYFVENRGQLDPKVAYSVQGKDTTLYFTSQGVTFSLPREEEQREPSLRKSSRALSEASRAERWNLKLDFVGANPDVKVSGAAKTEALVSYFKGPRAEWKTGLPTYASILYSDLWPGIDLVYSGTVNRLKYQFVVKPGADPERIRLAYRGASGLRLGREGVLEVETPFGGFTDDRPYSYQDIAGRRVEVSTEYALEPARSGSRRGYGFRLDAYDRNQPLILDPAVLVYAGYIGGASGDLGLGIAVDSAGNAYVTGGTSSTEATFPETVGPDLTSNGDLDAFVAKVNAAGTALVYAGYIGGASFDAGVGIAVDASGNAYVTGQANSTEATFPETVGPDLTHNGGVGDAFVAKINAAGTGLVYAGYIGGAGVDEGSGIAVDSAGNAYVTGYTDSTEATFPETVGPDLTYNGGRDAFVAKVSATGAALVYAGYIGGANLDLGYGIAVDSAGNAYVTGRTASTEATFPVIVGPDLTSNGGSDAFVAKVSATGAALVYAGYIGGDSLDLGRGIAVDSAGNAYVTGSTDSTEATFPETVGPDLTYNGGEDAFVAKVNATGAALLYAGYIGGAVVDQGLGIAVDSAGNAYVTGLTGSTEATFPETVGPDLTYNGGFLDAFVAKVNAAGAALLYAGYIGGAGNDQGFGIAVDSAGNAYVTGATDSTEATFPETVGPDLTYNGGGDAFVAKVSEQVGGKPTVTPTATPTVTPTVPGPTATLTATPTSTPPVPTSTPTFTPPSGPPGGVNVPTLSFPMLLLLGLGLAVTALFLMRRA